MTASRPGVRTDARASARQSYDGGTPRCTVPDRSAARARRTRWARPLHQSDVDSRRVRPWFAGEYVMIPTSLARIVTGRTYRERVRRLLRHG